MQPPPKEGAWSALFSNLSKSDLDSYVVKRFKRPLLEEVSWSRLPSPIDQDLLSKSTGEFIICFRIWYIGLEQS